MSFAPNLEANDLASLKRKIEAFVSQAAHPAVIENEERLFDLHSSHWRLSIAFGKLILEVWNPLRNLRRNIEELAFQDFGRLGLSVRRSVGQRGGVLEIRELGREIRLSREAARGRFRTQLVMALAKQFPDWTFERVSNRSDRERSLSGIYTRGLARRGRIAWGFLGVSPAENPDSIPHILGFGLVWLHWLQTQLEGVAVQGLKLFLPAGFSAPVAHRMAHLNGRLARFELYEGVPEAGPYRQVDIHDYGNVETRLRPYCGEEPQLSGHRKWLARADRKGENAPRQPELWLEELLCQDVSRIDHLLDNLSVYRQVFSFVGADRGILDILTWTRNGRLAVLELKMQEDVNFVLQGLDYWMRVQWLNDRSQLQKFGYFPHRPLSSRSPLLYLISPAFRFHSTTDGVARYLSPQVEVIKVGIAPARRRGIQVLFRRQIQPPVTAKG